jgi:hypothetical protein
MLVMDMPREEWKYMERKGMTMEKPVAEMMRPTNRTQSLRSK